MKDLSFSNALRYVFPSMVVYFYLYLCDRTLAENVIKSLGVLGNISFIFVGSIIYLLYRPFLYNGIIIYIQDLSILKPDNYRTWLKKEYSVRTYKSMLLWIQIRDKFKEKYFKDSYSASMQEIASGIHLLYLSSVIAIFFIVWGLCIRWGLIISDLKLVLIFIFIALTCSCAAFLLDRSYESIELGYLRSIDKKELDLFVSTIRQDSEPASKKKDKTG